MLPLACTVNSAKNASAVNIETYLEDGATAQCAKNRYGVFERDFRTKELSTDVENPNLHERPTTAEMSWMEVTGAWSSPTQKRSLLFYSVDRIAQILQTQNARCGSLASRASGGPNLLPLSTC